MTVFRGVRDEAAAAEVAGDELIPVVTVRVGSAKDEDSVLNHHRKLAATDTDLGTVGHVDTFFPQLLSAVRVEADRRKPWEIGVAVTDCSRLLYTYGAAAANPSDCTGRCCRAHTTNTTHE